MPYMDPMGKNIRMKQMKRKHVGAPHWIVIICCMDQHFPHNYFLCNVLPFFVGTKNLFSQRHCEHYPLEISKHKNRRPKTSSCDALKWPGCSFIGKMLGKPLAWYPSCSTPRLEPFKGGIPNKYIKKYSLYRVYMGLIIKGTIPRVPPFSLWFLMLNKWIHVCIYIFWG